MISPDVLNIPQCIHGIPHMHYDIPRCTHDISRCTHGIPRCTHGIPDVLKIPRCTHDIPRCTEHPPLYCTPSVYCTASRSSTAPLSDETSFGCLARKHNGLLKRQLARNKKWEGQAWPSARPRSACGGGWHRHYVNENLFLPS